MTPLTARAAATEKALKLIAKGLTPYAAAKKVGIALVNDIPSAEARRGYFTIAGGFMKHKAASFLRRTLGRLRNASARFL